MVFERANAGDISALVNLRISYIREDHRGLTDDIEKELITTVSTYFENHLNQDLFVYVARENSIVSCAFLVITEIPANCSFITGRIGTVYNVYTIPEYRQKGFAKRVMQELLSDADKFKLDFVDLKASKDGYHLYETLGFKEVVSKHIYMKREPLAKEPK